MRRFELTFVKYVGYLCSLLFGAMVAVSLAQVFFRYVLNDSLTWSEELARYLFVWVSFLGAAIALHRKMHIAVDILTSIVSERVRRIMLWLTQIAVVGLLIVLILYGVRISVLTWNTPSAALRMPMGLVYMAIPVGAFCMLVVLICQLIDRAPAEEDAVRDHKEEGYGSLYTN